MLPVLPANGPVSDNCHRERISESPRLLTGVPGLDDILLGGLGELPKGHMYLVEGSAGTDKTTLGLQFLVEGKRSGERCLYVTLSETKAELEFASSAITGPRTA